MPSLKKVSRTNGCVLTNNKESLKKLFYPHSIAVIGASNTVGKLGYNVFYNLLNHKFPGKLYPVNTSTDYVQGVKSYPEIAAIDDEIDEAIIIVPAGHTPYVVKQCCDKGVKFIVNEAAGFSEIGVEGKAIEQECREILRTSDTRMLGPNCSGLVNTHNNMVQSIGLVGPLEKGNIGLIAQAGVYASGLLWGFRQIMNFGIVVTVGNKLDLNETDILEYLGTDDNIKLVCMYLEDIKAGRRFIDVAREVTRTKPVIAVKGGRTDVGRKTAASHTASMAGNAEIYKAVFKQSGVINAEHYRDMFNITKAFSKQPLPDNSGVMIISYTGAMGVTTTDTCYEKGLRLATLSADSLRQLEPIMPVFVKAKNPVDLTFDQTPEQVAKILEICAADSDVSAFIVILQAELAQAYSERFKNLKLNGKPLLISIPGRNFAPLGMKLEVLGYPVYDAPETAVGVLARMHWFARKADKFSG